MMKIKKWNWWTTEKIHPSDPHDSRYKAYMARIDGVDSKGNEIRSYLPVSVMPGIFYDVSKLHSGDIIVASNYNKEKKWQDKRYYIVVDNTESEITLRGGDKDGIYNTYAKALHFKSSNMTDISETVKTYELF